MCSCEQPTLLSTHVKLFKNFMNKNNKHNLRILKQTAPSDAAERFQHMKDLLTTQYYQEFSMHTECISLLKLEVMSLAVCTLTLYFSVILSTGNKIYKYK